MNPGEEHLVTPCCGKGSGASASGSNGLPGQRAHATPSPLTSAETRTLDRSLAVLLAQDPPRNLTVDDLLPIAIDLQRANPTEPIGDANGDGDGDGDGGGDGGACCCCPKDIKIVAKDLGRAVEEGDERYDFRNRRLPQGVKAPPPYANMIGQAIELSLEWEIEREGSEPDEILNCSFEASELRTFAASAYGMKPPDRAKGGLRVWSRMVDKEKRDEHFSSPEYQKRFGCDDHWEVTEEGDSRSMEVDNDFRAYMSPFDAPSVFLHNERARSAAREIVEKAGGSNRNDITILAVFKTDCEKCGCAILARAVEVWYEYWIDEDGEIDGRSGAIVFPEDKAACVDGEGQLEQFKEWLTSRFLSRVHSRSEQWWRARLARKDVTPSDFEEYEKEQLRRRWEGRHRAPGEVSRYPML